MEIKQLLVELVFYSMTIILSAIVFTEGYPLVRPFLKPLYSKVVHFADTEVVFKDPTDEKLVNLLEKLDFKSVENLEPGKIKFTIDDTEVQLKNNHKGRLCLVSEFPESDMALEQLNEWNAQYLFARAYIDESGDLVVQQDLIMTGGISERGLVSYFKIYRRLILEMIEVRMLSELAEALSDMEETESMELELIRL